MGASEKIHGNWNGHGGGVGSRGAYGRNIDDGSIDLAKGTVTIAGEKILDPKSAKLLDRVKARTTEAAACSIPHLRTRMRELAIVKYRVEQNLSFEEIGRKPDVKMSRNGVIKAYYRLQNPLIDPQDIKAHLEQSLRTTELASEMAFSLFDPKKPLSSVAALKTVIDAQKRKSSLLGLDAPKNLRLTAGAGVFGLLASSEPIDPEQLKAIQALDPIIKPDKHRIEPAEVESVEPIETIAEPSLITEREAG